MSHKLYFSNKSFFTNGTPKDVFTRLSKAAEVAVRDVLRVKAGEQVLIITNPDDEAAPIAMSLYDAAGAAGGKPVLMIQDEKTQLDFAEKTVLAAFGANPEVVISISSGKLGKDAQGIANPYKIGGKGVGYDHIFHLKQYGEKSCRAFWSPGVTIESFCRTVPIDYAALRAVCGKMSAVLDAAVKVHVTAPGGTDITLGLAGRKAKSDDGDFSFMGAGGNLPAGETFISPENGTACGTIVFDGSISINTGDMLVQTPVVCQVEDGFVVGISGGREAELLLDTITKAENNAILFEKEGKLLKGQGEVYARNARNIGELGIGLNAQAHITGNMLEDEKCFHTCHFAIGQNYDEDAPALIHLDAVVRKPTIIAIMPDGCEVPIEKDGEPV
ncbi:MAG: aminopeptidase [Spirochaetaceae bacterium]|jgi:leucyl aminopeptidase (aminopeptidase T)|nr:aminopeptidase [Spirochaetaceae bacterium]